MTWGGERLEHSYGPPERIHEGGYPPHEKLKSQTKNEKCFEIGLYVSYRAENLHAEIFVKGIRVF